MSRSQLLSTLSEREWVQAWDSEQKALDRLRSQRGSWLPNVVEVRDWGALRWTSGQPSHAGSSGQAVAETFAVFRPDLDDRTVRRRILDALRERPPVRRILGFGFREYHLRGAILGGLVGVLVCAATLAVLGAGGFVVLAGALVGAAAGAAVGTAIVHARTQAERQEILADVENVRTISGRYAPSSWSQLVAAATVVSKRLEGNETDAAREAREFVHGELWDAAGILLTSSDHSGVEVKAQKMAMLAGGDRQ
jgi:hypothetical protein